MTGQPSSDTIAAAAIIGRFDPDALPAFIEDGFRSLVSDDDTAPFGPAYAFLVTGEDITADLAAAFRLLPARSRTAFNAALCAVFRRLNTASEIDRRILKLVLRLAAKIRCYKLLSFLPQKLFREDGALPDSQGLLPLALETAIELSGGSPDAGDRLRDIAVSRLFRSTAATTLLLALVAAEPDNLLQHMVLLQEALASQYGTETNYQGPNHARRVQLVADLSEVAASGSAVQEAVEFALANPDWQLGWFGDLVLTAPDADELDEDELESVGILTRRVEASPTPRLAARIELPERIVPTRDEWRTATIILNADTFDLEEEDRILRQTVDLLIGMRSLDDRAFDRVRSHG